MSCTDFNTFNPTYEIEIVDGKFPETLLYERTLSLLYIDRLVEFDTIEWELDNHDGIFTRPEYIAAGMAVKIKMGYLNATFPWRSFIINRITGGVGVYGRERPSVGANECRVVFFGRNRNAPGGRTGRQLNTRKAIVPPKRLQKGAPFKPTSDIVSMELRQLDRKEKPKEVYAATTADAVLQIARRNGFDYPYVAIQETNDEIEQVVIRENESDGTFLSRLAGEWDFQFKIDSAGIFHWHSPYWDGVPSEIAETLKYGMGADILTLDIDCDFTLPVPKDMKSTGYSFKKRSVAVFNLPYSQAMQQAGFSAGTSDFMDDTSRARSLMQNYSEPVLATTVPMATLKAQQTFMARHYRAFQINCKCVGNPRLLAGRIAIIEGTGSPFVDGQWLISEARHRRDNGGYITEIKLKHPPTKAKAKAGGKLSVQVKNLGYNQQMKTPNIAQGVADSDWQRTPKKFPRLKGQ